MLCDHMIVSAGIDLGRPGLAALQQGIVLGFVSWAASGLACWLLSPFSILTYFKGAPPVRDPNDGGASHACIDSPQKGSCGSRGQAIARTCRIRKTVFCMQSGGPGADVLSSGIAGSTCRLGFVHIFPHMCTFRCRGICDRKARDNADYDRNTVQVRGADSPSRLRGRQAACIAKYSLDPKSS